MSVRIGNVVFGGNEKRAEQRRQVQLATERLITQIEPLIGELRKYGFSNWEIADLLELNESKAPKTVQKRK